MLRITLSMNLSAKHESPCSGRFYKVTLLCCLNHFSTSTVCLLFWKEKVKAQGEGPDVRLILSDPSSLFPLGLSLNTSVWLEKGMALLEETLLFYVWSLGFGVLLSLQSSNKLLWLYTCCMHDTPLSLGAVAVPKKYTPAIPRPRLWMGWENVFLISNSYPEITSED